MRYAIFTGLICLSFYLPAVEFVGKPINSHYQQVIVEIIGDTGINYVNVTDLSRTARDQAKAMYNCSEVNKCAQYGSEGRKILAVYAELKKQGASKETIVDKMTEKAREVAETARKKGQLQHMFDDVMAIDLSKRKVPGKVTVIEHGDAFVTNCNAHPQIKRCFGPGHRDPLAFHLEIKK